MRVHLSSSPSHQMLPREDAPADADASRLSHCAEAAEQGKELEAFPSAEEQGQTGKADDAADSDLHNLERRKDRTLYLLAKKKRSQHAWQFRMFTSLTLRTCAHNHLTCIILLVLACRSTRRRRGQGVARAGRTAGAERGVWPRA